MSKMPPIGSIPIRVNVGCHHEHHIIMLSSDFLCSTAVKKGGECDFAYAAFLVLAMGIGRCCFQILQCSLRKSIDFIFTKEII